MPKFLLLLSCWFIASGSVRQNPPTGFPDTLTITENSVGKARIGMPLAQLKEVYKGCAFSPTYLVRYGFDEYGSKPNATMVSNNGQKMFVFWLNTQTRRVSGLIALSSSYQTARGIRVGTTSGQLKAVLPALRVGPGELMANMEIAAVETGEEKLPIVQYIFYKQGVLGKGKGSIVPSEIAVANAKIAWIQVFPNP